MKETHVFMKYFLDVTMMDDPSWAQFSLAMLETMCEVGVRRSLLAWDISSSGDLRPPASVRSALNCPSECSGHGQCDQGLQCQCYEGYSSHDCSFVDTIPDQDTPVPFPILAAHNSLCDVNSEDCSVVSVIGQDFVSSDQLSCRVREISVEDSEIVNWKYLDSGNDYT